MCQVSEEDPFFLGANVVSFLKLIGAGVLCCTYAQHQVLCLAHLFSMLELHKYEPHNEQSLAGWQIGRL